MSIDVKAYTTGIELTSGIAKHECLWLLILMQSLTMKNAEPVR